MGDERHEKIQKRAYQIWEREGGGDPEHHGHRAEAEIDSLRFAGEDVLRVHPYPRALRRAIVYVHQHPILFSTTNGGATTV